MSIGVPLPSRNFNERETEQVEQDGRYHFQGPRMSDLSKLKRQLDATTSEKEEAALSVYQREMPPTFAMPWSLQGLPLQYHKKCRSSDRHFQATIYMCEAMFLKESFTPYKDLSLTTEVGHVWIGACPEAGSSVTIQLGNIVFVARVPVLAMVYEIITANDIDHSYVAVIFNSVDYAYSFVGRFGCEAGDIKALFHLYSHPHNKNGADFLNPPQERRDGRIVVSGGSMGLKACASFLTTHAAYQSALRQVLTDWKTADLAMKPIEYSGSSPEAPKGIQRFVATNNMLFSHTAEAINDIRPLSRIASSAIGELKRRISTVTRYFSDCPLWPPVFGTITDNFPGLWPQRIENLVFSEGQYLLTKPLVWTEENDSSVTAVKELNLGMCYDKETGVYNSALPDERGIASGFASRGRLIPNWSRRSNIPSSPSLMGQPAINQQGDQR